MESDKIALAKRAVWCRGWRWMQGMLTINGGRVFAVDEDGSCRLDFGAEEVPFWCTPQTMAKMFPELTDSATLGCLLSLVREAWGMPTGITVTYSSDEGSWGVSWSGATHGGWCGRGRTEAEALINALENATND
jgi:hypothetical protein